MVGYGSAMVRLVRLASWFGWLAGWLWLAMAPLVVALFIIEAGLLVGGLFRCLSGLACGLASLLARGASAVPASSGKNLIRNRHRRNTIHLLNWISRGHGVVYYLAAGLLACG